MRETAKTENKYSKDRSGGLFYGWIVCGTCITAYAVFSAMIAVTIVFVAFAYRENRKNVVE